MPTININGQALEFEAGQTILQVALDHEIEIPHYCWHPGLSVVASCRICLAEVHAPNPRNDNKVEYVGKLLPTCQTPAADGQVVYINSPRAAQNQKAVMEHLLINHPIDCSVCDQAGECHLQDYSYQYGRGKTRFEEQKIKQPKKDVGPNVLLYSDRCIMCTRCVRFTREVTGTGELMVEGRGAFEQIDVFPGVALDNPLAGNVIDLCPVGALLDKEFLFQQRVWFLTKTPSIDGLTCSGDNITIEHNKGTVYRLKPRANMDVNRWWITDELRYGWQFIHDEERLHLPAIKDEPAFEDVEAPLAWDAALARSNELLAGADKTAVLLSPMLSCEDAWLLATTITNICPDAILGVGPIPTDGEDQTFKDGFTMYAEKAPNARGVRRVLESLGGTVHDYDKWLNAGKNADTWCVTGNYPSNWVTENMAKAAEGKKTIVIDTLPNALTETADVLLPSATWMEKAGTFENVNNRLQLFERAISPIDYCKSESQIALDMQAAKECARPEVYNGNTIRQRMADTNGLVQLVTDVHRPVVNDAVASDMEMVEL